MLKKEAIFETVACWWSNEDMCFVARSSLFPRVLGTGDTKEIALQDFRDVVDDVYEHITTGNVQGYDKRGRPAKGGIDFHVQVRPETKQFIDKFGTNLDISKGEVIDYLVSFVDASNKSMPQKVSNSSAMQTRAFKLKKFELPNEKKITGLRAAVESRVNAHKARRKRA
jgi:hypothetical protein